MQTLLSEPLLWGSLHLGVGKTAMMIRLRGCHRFAWMKKSLEDIGPTI